MGDRKGSKRETKIKYKLREKKEKRMKYETGEERHVKA
jgi:hypothetical protein